MRTAAAFRSVLVSVTVTSELKGWWGWQRRGWTLARGHDDNATGKGGGGDFAMRKMATKELGKCPDYYYYYNENDNLPLPLSSRTRLVTGS